MSFFASLCWQNECVFHFLFRFLHITYAENVYTPKGHAEKNLNIMNWVWRSFEQKSPVQKNDITIRQLSVTNGCTYHVGGPKITIVSSLFPSNQNRSQFWSVAFSLMASVYCGIVVPKVSWTHEGETVVCGVNYAISDCLLPVITTVDVSILLTLL